ncbi:MAG: hypothetical protein M1820_000419 [Bogoriella megaspora]|nr:MAG: hypothetical protein M1820_000419 [Bogoriella megaspora]
MSAQLASYLLERVAQQARRLSEVTMGLSHVRANPSNPLAASSTALQSDDDKPQDEFHEHVYPHDSNLHNPVSPLDNSFSSEADLGRHNSHAVLVDSPRAWTFDVDIPNDEPSPRTVFPEVADSLRQAEDLHNSETSYRTTGAGTIPGNIAQREGNLGTTTVQTTTDGTMEITEGNSMGGVRALPEDDGMRSLRLQIKQIWETEGTSEEKARWMHMLMTKNYNVSRGHLVVSPSSLGIETPEIAPAPVAAANPGAIEELIARFTSVTQPTTNPEQDYDLKPDDMVPTYWREPQQIEHEGEGEGEEEEGHVLGCEHYKRNVKVQYAKHVLHAVSNATTGE